MNIGIYIYDNVEVLDFSGPFEVFSTATRINKDDPDFNVFLIGKTKSITARGGFCVAPNYLIDNHPPLDILIVSGGVHNQEMRSEQTCKWVAEQSKKAKFTVSVCTGVFILAAAGVITDHSVTTHWEDINDLKNQFPKLNVIEKRRWVKDKNIISSGGISAGIDMSLYLLSLLSSPKLAELTAKQMEYSWKAN